VRLKVNAEIPRQRLENVTLTILWKSWEKPTQNHLSDCFYIHPNRITRISPMPSKNWPACRAYSNKSFAVLIWEQADISQTEVTSMVWRRIRISCAKFLPIFAWKVLKMRVNFFSERVAVAWNSLPPSVVNFASLRTFKRTIVNANLKLFTIY